MCHRISPNGNYRIFRTCRFLMMTCAVTAMVYACSILPAYAQGATGIVPLVTNDPISEYLTKGGAFAVIFVLLFFYRRDWQTAVEFWKDQHRTTTELIQQAARAQADNSAAVRENSLLIQQLTFSLKQNNQSTDKPYV